MSRNKPLSRQPIIVDQKHGFKGNLSTLFENDSTQNRSSKIKSDKKNGPKKYYFKLQIGRKTIENQQILTYKFDL